LRRDTDRERLADHEIIDWLRRETQKSVGSKLLRSEPIHD